MQPAPNPTVPPTKIDWADRIVKIGLAIKGIDSLLEVVGGGLFLFPSKVALWLYTWGAHELYKNHDALAGRIDNFANIVDSGASLGSSGCIIRASTPTKSRT